MAHYKRKLEPTPFRAGDVNVELFKKNAKRERPADQLLLRAMSRTADDIDDLAEDHIIKAFNTILDSPQFFNQVDKENLVLRPEIDRLIEKAGTLLFSGRSADKKMTRTINRALLHALYPVETTRIRQHERFASPSFLSIPVSLTYLPPYFGAPTEGLLVDLSAGGMALLLNEKIPVGTRLMLKGELSDRSKLESEVEIRHGRPYDKKQLQGFEFLNIPAFMREKINRMAADYLACDTRIKKQEDKICKLDCSFYNLCTKPQRIKPVV